MQPLYDYRLAAGHNVALGSMTNVENLIRTVVPLRRLPPRSGFIDQYPTRQIAISGREYGDGLISTEWRWDNLPLVALDLLQDTYLPGGVVSAPVTIHTRNQDTQAYQRANAFMVRPQPEVDYTLRGRRVVGLVIRFRNLVFI